MPLRPCVGVWKRGIIQKALCALGRQVSGRRFHLGGVCQVPSSKLREKGLRLGIVLKAGSPLMDVSRQP
jgi:hypothetical protein